MMSLRPFPRKHCRAEENILSTLLLVVINLRNVIEARVGVKKIAGTPLPLCSI
jgi:hypothetical protein